VTGPATTGTSAATVTINNTNTSGTTTLGAFTSASSVTTGGETLAFTGTGNTSVSGPITPTTTVLGLSKSGAGTLTLNGADGYTGGTTTSGGIILLGNNSALGTAGLTFSTSGSSVLTNGAFTIANTIAANVGGSIIGGNTANTSEFSGGITVGTSGFQVTQVSGGTLTLSGAMGVSGNNRVATFNNIGSVSVTGNITGNSLFTLTQAGAGTTTLSGTNAFVGSEIKINGGTLALNNNSALSGATDVVFGGGTLQYVGSTTTDYSGKIAAGTSASAVAIDTSGQNISFGSALTINQTGGLTKLGAATLTVTAANAYTGTTTVGGGTLKTTGSGKLGSVNNNLTVNTGGTLDMASTSQGVGALNGTGGNIFNSTASSISTLTVGNNDATGGSYAGAIANNGGAGGTVALTKTGAGTQILAGADTYSGDTNVNAGKLLVSGSISGSTTNVNSGGTLGGTGSVAGITLNAGGAIEAGSTSDDLAATALTWNGETSGAFAQMKFELSAVDNTSDKLTLSGALTKGTGSTFLFDFQNGGAASGSYTLLSFASQNGFSAGDFSYTNLAPGLSGTFNLQSNALVLSVVPEPKSAALLLGGIAVLGLRHRRRIA
jgi:fibronectin-binding autotransporter adhesin